jgi:outer membrane immunogenic protein
MVRRFWGGVALLVSIAMGSGVAGAADLAVKAPVYKAAPVILSDWAGFYIGVHGGYGWGHSSIDTPDFPYLQPEKEKAKEGEFLRLGSFNADPKGGVVGGHAGYNWQYGHVVTGLEIDFSAADIKAADTVGTFLLICLPGPGTISRTLKFDELATARARLGYLVLPDLLAYGTAGAAWGHSELTGAVEFIGSGSAGASNFGWAAGGGLEYKLWEHLLVRAEYLHYDFAKTTYNTPVFTTTAATAIDVARAGLSYKF